jgi:hypothetical protein
VARPTSIVPKGVGESMRDNNHHFVANAVVSD